MSTNPSYLQTAADGRVKNYRDWGLPLGRRFRALKLWFLIREQGVEGAAGAAAPRHRERGVARGEVEQDTGLESDGARCRSRRCASGMSRPD